MKLQPLRNALSGYKSARWLHYKVTTAGHRTAVAARLETDRWLLAHRTGLSGGRILAYHSIGTPQFGVIDVTPRAFERHLQIAVDEGWTFGTPADVMADPTRRVLALTFDDGPTTVLTNALPVLRHHGIPATAFVVTGWADGEHIDGFDYTLDWSGIETLAAAGMTVASHSVTHPNFGKLSADEALRELTESRERLRVMLGIDTEEFCIPYGQSANWTDAAGWAAKQAGYKIVYAQAAATRPPDTVPRNLVTRLDTPHIFRAILRGAYDSWEMYV